MLGCPIWGKIVRSISSSTIHHHLGKNIMNLHHHSWHPLLHFWQYEAVCESTLILFWHTLSEKYNDVSQGGSELYINNPFRMTKSTNALCPLSQYFSIGAAFIHNDDHEGLIHSQRVGIMQQSRIRSYMSWQCGKSWCQIMLACGIMPSWTCVVVA